MKIRISVTVILMVFSVAAMAQLKLPRLIRDSMVLQRDTKINVWGWAANGEKITLKFNGKTYKAATGNDGRWMMQIAPTQAGGPYTMQVSSRSNTITLRDVLVGDVWICSGQSNMVHSMGLHSVRYADEVAKANYPAIRQFWIPTMTDLQQPHEDLPAGYWKAADPKTVLDFSAVAYFFAKDIYEKYHIPIGLINASVGGTPIEAWTSEQGLKAFPELENTIKKNKDTVYTNSLRRNLSSTTPPSEDKGLSAAVPWYDPAYVPTHWQPINVPGYWEDQGIKDLNGVVWYRREIDVPEAMAGKPAKFFLGRIVDADIVYLNGKQIGATTYLYPQRRYAIPGDLLKPGKNLIVVRVTNNFGKGGFVPDKPYSLIAGNDTVDLKGYWQYKVGEVFAAGKSGGSWFSAQNQPTALFNAMLAPTTNYTIKGFLWYQGESNTGNAAGYAKLQPAMIADWRRLWKQGNLPFLYVQLPGFGDYNYSTAPSQWADFREAQSQSLSVPNTAMAVAIDLGEWNDIHPDRKKEVGDRLALAAETIVYGENKEYSGPVYQSSTIEGGKIIIAFSHTGGGLVTNDGEAPAEFAIAGDDKKFMWAQAKIEGDKVIVWSDEIKAPKYVRYAWADNPVNPNLYNKEGLPASPFQTP